MHLDLYVRMHIVALVANCDLQGCTLEMMHSRGKASRCGSRWRWGGGCKMVMTMRRRHLVINEIVHLLTFNLLTGIPELLRLKYHAISNEKKYDTNMRLPVVCVWVDYQQYSKVAFKILRPEENDPFKIMIMNIMMPPRKYYDNVSFCFAAKKYKGRSFHLKCIFLARMLKWSDALSSKDNWKGSTWICLIMKVISWLWKLFGKLSKEKKNATF